MICHTPLSLFVALLTLTGCSLGPKNIGTPEDTDTDADTGTSASAAETTTQVTEATTVPDVTTGPDVSTSTTTADSDDSTEPGTGPGTTEGATETSDDTFDDTDSNLPSTLDTCDVPEPCDTFKTYCDYDNCAQDYGQGVTEQDLCVWSALRDGTSVRVRMADNGEGHLNALSVSLGDPDRGVLWELRNGGAVQFARCTLADPAFFQACIDAPTENDDCWITGAWFAACELAAPMCPGI